MNALKNPIQDAIVALTKIKAATNRSPTTLAADVFSLASQSLAALQAAPAHTESSQFANDENPRLTGAPAQGSIDTPEFCEQRLGFGELHGDACPACNTPEGRAHIAQRAASGDAPALTVWSGAMPESNGKSNFTATLMRKGGSLMDSGNFTFVVSEYPDRVRYEADCMRYLIGELDAEPCSLDYDAEKHSGYSAPAPIADEVAGDTVAWLITLPGGELESGVAYFDKGEADDYIENRAIKGCYLTELIVRPAAPKAIACPLTDKELADPEYMRAYVESMLHDADLLHKELHRLTPAPTPSGCPCDPSGADRFVCPDPASGKVCCDPTYAPPASAPDAPAGEFRRYYDTETCSAEQAHACVLADRAARAAAAPAGHAEPVTGAGAEFERMLATYATRPDKMNRQAILNAVEMELSRIAAPVAAEPAPTVPVQPGTTCWCATCRPITLADMRMVLCPTCGNKRCPRAADHRNECTNSNEPGKTAVTVFARAAVAAPSSQLEDDQ